MCDKRFELGHKTYRIGSLVSVTSTLGPDAIPADSTRRGIRVSLTDLNEFTTATGSVRIGPVVNGAIQPVLFLTAAHPVDEIHFDDYGTAVFDKMGVICDAGDVVTLSVSQLLVREVRF